MPNAKSSFDSDEVREEAGLPGIVFLFTLDQICAMINVDEQTLRKHYLFYAGRSIGAISKGEMYAVNIAPDDMPSQWRVSHREFIRWCRAKKIRLYDAAKLL